MQFNKAELVNLEYSLKRELLATNRAGGYCNTTIVCCNTRKYHGLFAVPIEKFGGHRYMLLSALDETLFQHGMPFNLGIHCYGDVYEPRGHKYIVDFEMDPYPVITYRVGGMLFKKEILFAAGSELLMIRYTLLDESGTLEIRNLQYFTDNSRYETLWEVSADGETVQRGTIDALIPPQEARVVHIPLRRTGLSSGKHYYLTVSTVLKQDEIWAPARHEVAWEQFELASWYTPTAPAPVLGRAALRRDGGRTFVEGDGFRYAFDPDGRRVSIVYDGREMLTRPLELNVWRAPVANELDGWNGRSAGTAAVEGYGSIGHAQVLASHYYAAGLDRIRRVPARVEAREAGGNVIVEVRDLAVFGGGQTQLDAYISGRSFNGFEEIWTYRIDGAHRVL